MSSAAMIFYAIYIQNEAVLVTLLLPGSTPTSFRRFSMSATAPAFVPGHSGLFTRQSISIVRAKTTALSFPERDQAKKGFNDEAFLVAPRGVSTDMPPEPSSKASALSSFQIEFGRIAHFRQSIQLVDASIFQALSIHQCLGER